VRAGPPSTPLDDERASCAASDLERAGQRLQVPRVRGQCRCHSDFIASPFAGPRAAALGVKDRPITAPKSRARGLRLVIVAVRRRLLALEVMNWQPEAKGGASVRRKLFSFLTRAFRAAAPRWDADAAMRPVALSMFTTSPREQLGSIGRSGRHAAGGTRSHRETGTPITWCGSKPALDVAAGPLPLRRRRYQHPGRACNCSACRSRCRRPPTAHRKIGRPAPLAQESFVLIGAALLPATDVSLLAPHRLASIAVRSRDSSSRVKFQKLRQTVDRHRRSNT